MISNEQIEELAKRIYVNIMHQFCPENSDEPEKIDIVNMTKENDGDVTCLVEAYVTSTCYVLKSILNTNINLIECVNLMNSVIVQHILREKGVLGDSKKVWSNEGTEWK